MSSAYDFITSINSTKIDLSVDTETDMKGYSPFVTNKTLSYFPDTLILANEMNRKSQIPSEHQYKFLLLTVPKKKRFTKWAKQEDNPQVKEFIETYGISETQAVEYLKLLSKQQIEALQQKQQKGGISK